MSATTSPAPHRPTLAHHRGVFALFFLYAIVLGAILSRLADMQVQMGVAEGALGLGLLGMPLGTQIMLIFGAPTVRRLGLRKTMAYGMLLLAAGQTAASLATGIPLFFAALTVAGFGIGAIEVVVNLEADRGEFMLGRRIMSRAHSFWSFGFFASGLVGAAAASARLTPWVHIAVLDILILALMAVVLYDIRPAPPRRAATDAGPAARFVWPDAAIMGLLAVTLSAMALEGAGNDWSIIYMKNTFATPPGLNGMAFALGAAAQALTRYFADPFVDRFGPLKVARSLLVLLGLGCLMVTFAPTPWVALPGFVLMGIGTATLFPLAMSAAAGRHDRNAAESVAALAQTSFVIFLILPPLLGFVGEHFGLRTAFGLGLPLVVLSLLSVRHLAPR